MALDEPIDCDIDDPNLLNYPKLVAKYRPTSMLHNLIDKFKLPIKEIATTEDQIPNLPAKFKTTIYHE